MVPCGTKGEAAGDEREAREIWRVHYSNAANADISRLQPRRDILPTDQKS